MVLRRLAPEVAGGLGPEAVLDRTFRPPVVRVLHYEVEGWLGDDLVTTISSYLVSPAAAAALEQEQLTGFRLADTTVTIAPDTADVDPRILTFRWLQVSGRPGVQDVAVDDLGRLVLNDRALAVLQRFRLDDAEISDWPPA